MNVSFEYSGICVSLGIRIETRTLVRSNGGGLQGRGNRLWWYKALKGNSRIARVESDWGQENNVED